MLRPVAVCPGQSTSPAPEGQGSLPGQGRSLVRCPLTQTFLSLPVPSLPAPHSLSKIRGKPCREEGRGSERWQRASGAEGALGRRPAVTAMLGWDEPWQCVVSGSQCGTFSKARTLAAVLLGSDIPTHRHGGRHVPQSAPCRVCVPGHTDGHTDGLGTERSRAQGCPCSACPPPALTPAPPAPAPRAAPPAAHPADQADLTLLGDVPVQVLGKVRAWGQSERII